MLLALLFCGALHAETVFYVKPDGNDARNGASEAEAFATLTRARDAIRALQPIMDDVTVHMLPGTYFMAETLTLGPQDSAPDGKWIVYRAQNPKQKPRLSGGLAIRGSWKDEGNGVRSIRAGESDFRQLYVDGRLAVTARDPNEGAWRRLKQWEPITKSIRLQGSGIMAKWARMEQVEFVAKKHWGMSRLHVKWWGTYDGDDVFAPKTTLEFDKAHVPPKAIEQYYFFENALELLDAPGEWYLDRAARRLYYKPRTGEDLNRAEVIALRLERLVELNDTANVSFDGLIFEHANWLYPNGDHGYVGCQANVQWDGWNTNPGAIHLTDTRNIRFVNNVVRNTTAAGLVLVKGTQGTHVEGNVFTEIGDTPIVVYAEKEKVPPEKDQCRDDLIRNNLVSSYGSHNYAASGICVAVATRCTIEHNEVRDGGYAGITYGYFSKHESPSAGSRIQFNHVHHVMKELDDGAGIYVYTTQFDQSNSTLLIYRNFIHDVYRGETAEWNPVAGIYLDESSSGNTLRENVIRDVGNTIHLNTGGKEGGARPDKQVYDGNTDENALWEQQAGLEPAYAHLDPRPDKPAPRFEAAELIHRWPMDGDLKDAVGGSEGQLHEGAGFGTAQHAEGTAALVLDGKKQWVTLLPNFELPNRFTLAMRVWMPEKAFGERGLLASPNFRVYSAVDIAQFKEQLRTETYEGQHNATAMTLNGAFPRGRWNHLVITVDLRHRAQRVWVNGKDVTCTDLIGGGVEITGPLELGRFSDDARHARYFEGAFDDVRIYRGHLRSKDIEALKP